MSYEFMLVLCYKWKFSTFCLMRKKVFLVFLIFAHFLELMKVEINLYCVLKWVFLLIVRTILDCSQNSPLLS